MQRHLYHFHFVCFPCRLLFNYTELSTSPWDLEKCGSRTEHIITCSTTNTPCIYCIWEHLVACLLKLVSRCWKFWRDFGESCNGVQTLITLITSVFVSRSDSRSVCFARASHPAQLGGCLERVWIMCVSVFDVNTSSMFIRRLELWE